MKNIKSIRLFTFLFSCSLFLSCSRIHEDGKSLDQSAMTVAAKWNFHQSGASICEDDSSNSPTTCVFHFKGKRYLRNESYILDQNGKIDSVYSYHVPLWVNIYDMNTYGRLMMSLDTIGFRKMKRNEIIWDSEKMEIIDNGKSITPSLFESDSVIVYNKSNLTIYELKESE